MQTPCKPVAAAFLAFILLPLSFCLSQVPLRWIAEAQRPAQQAWEAYRGETLLLEPELREAGTAVAWTGAETATLYWQTNGMAAAWWSAAASVATGTPGRVRATWHPTNDVGAATYRFFVGVSGSAGGKSYRANGTLKMLAAPGYVPNALPLPRQSLDFAAVAVTNEPWATPADVAEAIGGIPGGGQEEDLLALSSVAAYSNHVRAAYLRGVEVSPGVWTIYKGE